jgi:hypothetical protein
VPPRHGPLARYTTDHEKAVFSGVIDHWFVHHYRLA